MDLYGESEYVIHFKYSNILNITYITMMYGLGLPILFPIAAFNFFNQWVCEKIVVAWASKQPPALDEHLVTNCITRLKFSSNLLLINGFWMLSNGQIFDNVWDWVDMSYDNMKSNHELSLTRMTYAFPCKVLIFISLGIFIS